MRHLALLLVVVVAVLPTRTHGQARTHVTTGGTLPANCTVGDIYYKTGSSAGLYACSATNTWTITSGSSAALSGLTAASASNTIASGNNHSQIWNWALTSNSVTALTFGETTAATGGTSQNQVLFGVNALASSTAVPMYIKNYGGSVSFQVDDVSGDTTPFRIWEDGKVSVAAASFPVATSNLRVDGGLSVEGGAATVVITNNGDIGTTTNDNLGFYTNNGSSQFTLSTSGRAQIQRSAPASITVANTYLQLGNTEFSANSYRMIGFGYVAGTHVPAYAGYQEMSVSGSTMGDLIFGTRAVTTDTLASERMRIDTQGTVILPSTSPTPAVSNTSSNSCGTTAATIAGNNNVGTVTVGATSGTDCTLTFTTTAPVQWVCMVNNATTANLARAVPTSTTTTRFVGTFVAGDLLNYICFAR